MLDQDEAPCKLCGKAVSVAALDREKILKEAVWLFKTELCHFPVYNKRSESQNKAIRGKAGSWDRNDLVERIKSELKPQRRLRFDEFLLEACSRQKNSGRGLDL